MLGAENITKLVNAVETPSSGYKALAYSVIAMAAYDYRRARLNRDGHTQTSIERFFRGRHFDTFGRGRINGDYIIDTLKKETLDDIKKMLRRGLDDGEVC